MRLSQFHRDGKIDDWLMIFRRLPDIEHGIDNFECEFRFCPRKAFRAVLKTEILTGRGCQFLQKFRTVDGNLFNVFF